MSEAISTTWQEFLKSTHQTESDAESEDFMRERPMNVVPNANGVFDTVPRHSLAKLLAASDFSKPQSPELAEWVATPSAGGELL